MYMSIFLLETNGSDRKEYHTPLIRIATANFYVIVDIVFLHLVCHFEDLSLWTCKKRFAFSSQRAFLSGIRDAGGISRICMHGRPRNGRGRNTTDSRTGVSLYDFSQ